MGANHTSFSIVPAKLANAMLSTPLGTEEAVEDALNIIDMLFFDVAARFKVIAEHRRARAAHHAQLLAQI